MDIIAKLTDELGVRRSQIEAAVKLIDEGNTIPFIARYRKEATGSLNDEVLRNLDERLTYLRNLEDRKNQVLSSIEEQGKLTEELKSRIESAETMVLVEDLYRPYRPKRKTRASVAKERGLEPLADIIWAQSIANAVEQEAQSYVNPENEVADVEAAIAGACDILAERIADEAEYRTYIREVTTRFGNVVSEAKDPKAESVYEMYYEFNEAVSKIAGHRVLALNRAENEKVVTVKIEAPIEQIAVYLKKKIVKGVGKDVSESATSVKNSGTRKSDVVLRGGQGGAFAAAFAKAGISSLNIDNTRPERRGKTKVEEVDELKGIGIKEAMSRIQGGNKYTTPILEAVIEDSYGRLIAPAIEREIRNALTDKAEEGAIGVFGKNLEQLLMQPPIAGHVVLGWDPAFRTGCKLAVVDETGKVLDTKVIFPTEPQNKVEEAKRDLALMIKKYNVSLISVGNGTASRESEAVIAEFLKEYKAPVQYVIVNEAGASVYSASKLATEEFPNFDVGQRSAASIARRLQDPLAELVKIDPKSIGVGQYQHDMNQKKLGDALGGVVEDCVNKVGVDLNTASVSLLEYVSGINKTIAGNIVAYREANGRFTNRRQLLKVPKLGPKAFEQCAGFMRILGGDEPLDATCVHPESYKAAKGLIAKCKEAKQAKDYVSKTNLQELASELEVGEITLKDIAEELVRPGRDPREDMPKPILKSDVLAMEDLKPGMVLKGTVRNVIDFGVFVDIGVHQDGLVHISQICDKFIKHPLEVVSVGDIVDVKVLDVDIKKKRISLTMKL